MVQSFECASCPNSNVYDYSDEVGRTFEQIPDSQTTLSTIGYSASGFYATDTICGGKTNDQCLAELQIFVVTEQQGIPDEASAVFGLSPDSETLYYMMLAGLVTEEKFAFYFTSSPEYSYFDIGVHDSTAVKTGYSTIV